MYICIYILLYLTIGRAIKGNNNYHNFEVVISEYNILRHL